MLQKLTDIQDCALAAADEEEIGKVKELYFDDQSWIVRYIVADTGGWLLGRKVLLPPGKMGRIDAEKKITAFHLTKNEIENSPPIEEHLPVSRQHEEAWNRYYGSAFYWIPEAVGVGGVVPSAPPVVDLPPPAKPRSDPHLRNTGEVLDYAIHATDGDIGKIEDFLIDDETWHIRYIVVLWSWLIGRRALLAPQWIEDLNWDESKAFISLPRTMITHAPQWDHKHPPTRAFEESLHRYYGRQVYWPE
jgi:hypothetical protein